jgi:ribosomal protein L34E
MTTSTIILAVVLSAVSPNGTDGAHNGPLKVPCIECHTHLPFPESTLSLRSDLGAVCGTCHQHYHGTDAMRSHPVNLVPSMRVPPDMLLDNEGRIACITCHAFHGEYRDEKGDKRFYLRRSPGKSFCFSCHKKLPGMPENKP